MAGRTGGINHLIHIGYGSPSERQLYWQFRDWSNGMFCPQTTPPPTQSHSGLGEDKQAVLLCWTSHGDAWRNSRQSWGFGLVGVTDIQIRVIKRVIQWCGFIFPCKWRLEGVDQGWQIYGESAHDSRLACWNTWADASEYCFRKDQWFLISLFFLDGEAWGQKLQETQLNSFKGLSRKRVRVWGT